MYCAMLRDGTKVVESPLRSGCEDQQICETAIEETGIHTGHREDHKVWRLTARPVCMHVCVSVCKGSMR